MQVPVTLSEAVRDPLVKYSWSSAETSAAQLTLVGLAAAGAPVTRLTSRGMGHRPAIQVEGEVGRSSPAASARWCPGG